MRHPREKRGIGPTRSRGSLFSPSAQENSLARQWVQSQEESQRNPVSRRFQALRRRGPSLSRGAGRRAEARPRALLRLSPAVPWSSSGHQRLGRPSSAAGGRPRPNPQRSPMLLSLLGFCDAGGQFFQGAEGPHGEIDGVSHFIPFSLLFVTCVELSAPERHFDGIE